MTDTVVAKLNEALECRYAVEGELGEGGMANVYLADDLCHERKVAIKVLKPEFGALVGAERFLAEIQGIGPVVLAVNWFEELKRRMGEGNYEAARPRT